MANKLDLMNKLKEVEQSSQIEVLRGLHDEKVMEERVTDVEERVEEHSTTDTDLQGEVSFVVPRGYELRPERKTGRFQLRLPPSVLEEVKELAQRESVSVNEWILEAIKEKSNVQ